MHMPMKWSPALITLIAATAHAQPAFDTHVVFGAAPFVNVVIASDLDGDGDIDAISASPAVGGGDSTLRWHENDNASFTTHDIATTGDNFTGLFAIDLDADGDVDILTGGSPSSTRWFENDGDQNFSAHLIDEQGRNVAAGDLDADGDIDVLSSVFEPDTVRWHENDGQQGFVVRDIYVGGSQQLGFSIADMDDDGDIDVVSAHKDGLRWHENDGGGGFTPHVVVEPEAANPFGVDLDQDGDMDIVAAQGLNQGLRWYENDGAQAFTPHDIFFQGGSLVHHASPADIDADGDIDLFSAARWDDTIRWHENDGDESFTTHVVFEGGHGPNGVNWVPAADIDGDGDTDAFSASLDNHIRWHENLLCGADVNLDGVLNILDFVAFQLLWQGEDPAADCDDDGLFDMADFVCYQQLFMEGCD